MRSFDEACLAAIRGEHTPPDDSDLVVNLCVLRGIRHTPGFATETQQWGSQFRRALNARMIMSNKIPDISSEDDFPYCIWLPEVASEETCAEVARRYPQMRYSVGRACAVARYTTLFHQLQLLPDISIADEARDNGCDEIFMAIMKQPTIYAIMNDYTRSINERSTSQGYYLNSDAAVRSSLNVRRDYRAAKRAQPPHQMFVSCGDYMYSDLLYKDGHFDNIDHGDSAPFSDAAFNITEDFNIDETSSTEHEEFITNLLYAPLPAHLPPGNKQLLILSAAYYGDIDRYVRLRRLNAVPSEYECVIRGIYHNTMFAKFWSTQPSRSGFETWKWTGVQKAITARYIMSNDLSRVRNINVLQIPFMIWYPDFPDPSTLQELVKICPDMELQVARTCIIADMEETYAAIKPAPHVSLLEQAAVKFYPFFRNDLHERRKALDKEPEPRLFWWWAEMMVVEKPFEQFLEELKRQTAVAEKATPALVKPLEQWIYDDLGVDISGLERYVCAESSPQS